MDGLWDGVNCGGGRRGEASKRRWAVMRANRGGPYRRALAPAPRWERVVGFSLIAYIVGGVLVGLAGAALSIHIDHMMQVALNDVQVVGNLLWLCGIVLIAARDIGRRRVARQLWWSNGVLSVATVTWIIFNVFSSETRLVPALAGLRPSESVTSLAFYLFMAIGLLCGLALLVQELCQTGESGEPRAPRATERRDSHARD